MSEFYNLHKSSKSFARLTTFFLLFIGFILNVKTLSGQVPSQLNADACQESNTFDEVLNLAAQPGNAAWYPFEFAPAAFQANVPFSNDNRLRVLILDSDGALYRPTEFQDEVFNKQGRQLDTPGAYEGASIEVFIDPNWSTVDRTWAEYQMVSLDGNTILEWSFQIATVNNVAMATLTNDQDPSVFLEVEVPAGEWAVLGMIRGNDNQLHAWVNESSAPLGSGIEELLSLGCAGFNTSEGITYSVYFDNLNLFAPADGCTDAAACNYDPTALCNDGSCDYTTCAGCTNPDAENYDPSASLDDGSCVVLPSWFGGLSYELSAANTIEGYNTYLIYLDIDDPQTELVAIYGVVDASSNEPLSISATEGDFYQNENGGVISSEINPALFDLDPNLAFDSYLTIGALAGNQTVQAAGLTNADFSAQGLVVDDAFGAVVYVVPGAEPLAKPNAEGKVLVGQMTINGSASLLMNFQFIDGEGEVVRIAGSNLLFPGQDVGCTDAEACNYNPLAVFDDASCTYPGCGLETACNYAPSAPCFENELCILPNGCADPIACNYDSNASCDDGSCEYLSCAGCTNPGALNYDASASIDDGSCNVPPAFFDGLSFEEVGQNTVDGYNTYRVYLNVSDPTVELTAIFGVQDEGLDAPLSLSSEGLFYQDPNGGLLASDINTGFYALLPDLEFDSYLTIGIEPGEGTVYSTGIENADFNENGLLVNDAVGGVIYIIPGTVPEAFPDANGQILVGQFTVSGESTLLMNFQFSSNGEAPQLLQATLSFPGQLAGCTDATACNYNPLAQSDDESCVFPGCLNPLACNYDASAACNDEALCILPDGCTNPLACNYDASALCDDGSCVLPNGCTNPEACNYNESATCDDGSCDFSCYGCTDETAANFDPNATIDDGSCADCFIQDPFDEFIVLSETPEAEAWFPVNYAPAVFQSPFAFDGDNRLRLVIFDGDGADDRPAAFSDPAFNKQGRGSFLIQDPKTVSIELYIPLAWLSTGREMAALDVQLSGGGSAPSIRFSSASGTPGVFVNDNGTEAFLALELSGDEWINLEIRQTTTGQYLYEVADASYLTSNYPSEAEEMTTVVLSGFNTDAGVTYTVYWDNLSTSPHVVGCTNPIACNYSADAICDDGSCILPDGCTDETACNYNPAALCDDGSCILPDGCTDPSACNYAPGALCDDGSCILPDGCTDESACNYNPLALCDDGSCILPDGCTNPLACNFDVNALCDDGSCILPDGCTDAGACNYDPAALCDDGSCDFTSCAGCTDILAGNYDPLATLSNQSCVYPDQETTFNATISNGELDGQNLSENGFASASYLNIGAALKATLRNGDDILPLGNVYSAEGGTATVSELDPSPVPGESTWSIVASVDLGNYSFEDVTVQLLVDFDPNPEETQAVPAQVDLSAYLTTEGLGETSSYVLFENPGSDFWEGLNLPDFPAFDPEVGGEYQFQLSISSAAGVQVLAIEMIVQVEVQGCTYLNAVNYNANATQDNGSCEFAGCTDAQALNYNPIATVDNGSCIAAVPGCMTPGADNYNPNANTEDGSCAFGGCTDPQALNYNELANIDDGTCVAVVSGCMTPIADNYNPEANVEDGSCTFDCGPGGNDTCPADITNDGTVNVSDLLAFLSAFGNDCP